MVDIEHPPPNVGKKRVQEGMQGRSIKSYLVDPKTWKLAVAVLRVGVWTVRLVSKVFDLIG